MPTDQAAIPPHTRLDEIARYAQEQRSSARYPYRVVRSVAPLRDGAQRPFEEVSCSDISTGGFSFLLDDVPDFQELLLQLNQDAHKLARIVSHEPIKSIPAILVHCQFLDSLDESPS